MSSLWRFFTAVSLLLLSIICSTAYAQTFSISGTLALPNGELASEDTQFSVQLRRTPSSAIVSDQNVVILNGQNSGEFNVQVFQSAMPGEQWYLVYFCTTSFGDGCDGYGSVGTHNASLGTQVSIDLANATLFPDAQNQSGVVFPVLEADLIAGTVSLPSTDVAPVGGITVTVSAFDTAGGAQFKSDTIEIAAGSSSASYSLSPAGADTDTQYRISYQCDPDCDGLYFTPGNYAGMDTVPEAADATLLNGQTDHPNTNLTLIKAGTISGALSLSSGVVAPVGNAGFSIIAADLKSSEFFLTQATIIEGESQVEYSIDLLEDTNARWVVTYSCFSGCADFYQDNSTRYSVNGTVVAFDAQTELTGSSSYSEIDMNVLGEHTISGTVALPNAETASGDIQVNVFASDDNDLGDSATQSVTVLSGQNSTPYSLTVPNLAALAADWQVGYFCQVNCAGLEESGFYNSTGTRNSENGAELLAGTQSYSGVDLTLISPNDLSGTLTLLGATFSSDLEISVTAENTTGASSNTTTVTIPANSNTSQPFVLAISSSPSDTWTLRYDCSSDCPGYVATAFQNTAATVVAQGDATGYPGGTSVGAISFPLLASTPIAGTLSLPMGVSSPPAGTVIRVTAQDEQVTDPPFTLFREELTVPNGATSVPYRLDAAPDASASWRVSYLCLSGCDGIFETGFFSTGGTVAEFEARTVLNGSDAPFPAINIDLIKADTISGVLSLFNSQTAPAAGIEFQVNVESVDFSEFFNTSVTIPSGQNSTPYSIKTVSNNAVGWVVRHACNSGCDGHNSTGYFSNTGTIAVREQATPLSGGTDHPNTDMMTLPVFSISGAVSLPSGQLAGVGGFEVRVEALDSVNSGSGSTTVVIPENQNSISYSLNISSDPAASWTVRYACFGQPNCVGLLDSGFHNSAGTVTRQSSASSLAPAQNHGGIDLQILGARTFMGTIGLPGVATAPSGGIEVDMSARAVTGSEFSEVSKVTIPAGQNSAAYQVDADVNLASDWVIQYLCTTNCDGFTTNGFFAGVETVAQFNNGTPLSTAQDHQGIDLDLISSVLFAGELILPNVDTGSDTVFSIVAEETTTSQQVRQEITVEQNTDREEFSLTIPVVAASEWRLRYDCESNCAGLTDIAYFAAVGTVPDEQDSDLLITDVSSTGLAFNVLGSISLSGTFRLPGSVVVDQDTIVTITAEGTSNGIAASRNITVLNGQGDASFTLMLPISEENLTLSYQCVSTCASIAARGFYNSAEGQFLEQNAEPLAGNVDRTALDFAAVARSTFSGSVNLPSSDVADAGPILIELLLESTTGDDQTQQVTILQKGDTVDFEFLVEPDPNDDFTLQYRCNSFETCLPYFNGFVDNTQSNLVSLSVEDASDLNAGSSQANLDLTMLESVQVSGSLSLPDGLLAPTGGINFSITSQRNNDQTLTGNLFSPVLVIPAGQNSTIFSTKISPEVTDGWRIGYLCSEPCGGFFKQGFFVSPTETSPYRSVFTPLDAQSNGLTSVALELIEKNTISGTVSMLQGRSAPAGGTQLDVRGFDRIVASSSADTETSVSIPAGQNEVAYDFDVPASTSGRWQVDYLCVSGCDDITLVAYYNSTGTVVDINEAELLPADSSHSNIDLILLDGDAEFNNDDDGDGVLNDVDNCRFIPNSEQVDSNSNGKGDLCDTADEGFCVPVRVQSGGIALICL